LEMRRDWRFRRALLLTAAVACLPVVAAHAADPVRIESLSGKAAEPLRFDADVRAAVFVFVSVDCPVSNRYAPEVRMLHDTFRAQGVQFTLVYPNPAEEAPAIRDHLKEYSYPLDALRDPRHAFVKHAGISITPEAAVYTPDGRLVYRGRIDDRYVNLGVERPVPTRRDLAESLTDVLAGKPVREPRTQAVGCYVADFAR